MSEVTDEMASEYARISQRVNEDPGNAGDEGEENWADLLREWLPPPYRVETRGRILGESGLLSPQVDVLVLHPSYPLKLLTKKTYLASAVLAAFECKLTLRAQHVRRAFETAAALHEVQRPRPGTPYDELHHPIVFGLLAHSHSWKGESSDPTGNIEAHIDKVHREVSPLACDVPDIVCVADLGTWSTMKMPSVGLLMRDFATGQPPEDFPVEADRAPRTAFMKPTSLKPGDQTTPIGSMFTKLLCRLAFEEPIARPLSDYFRIAGLLGSGESFSQRVWPSPYSAEVAARLPAALVNDGSSRWGMAFL